MRFLVTGHAGFVGFHTTRKLLARGDAVVGVDCLNPYYDVALKRGRLEALRDEFPDADYRSVEADLADQAAVEALFAADDFDRVIHLAAQPGVRHSIDHPRDYTRNNIDAFLNVLEGCRHAQTPHLTYASTSSVYGANTRMPFTEQDSVGHPLAIYAATKRANELMAHSYSHLYRLPTTGLRFFTVYGPWGRPDMAPFLFTRKILAGEPIEVFNGGDHSRDFTFVEDIVEGVVRAADRIAAPDPDWDSSAPDPASSSAPFAIYNIGNSTPVGLEDFIAAIESATGRSAIRIDRPMQPGDVAHTWADASALDAAAGYKPSTPVTEGVARFVEWYRTYYQI